jgi:glycosyltransferase involved in cell wall biosynthesis
MYPSKEYPFYGIFVKNFEKQLKNENIEFIKAVIKGRGKSKLDKLKKYINFFIYVYKTINENDYDLIYVHYAEHSLIPLVFLKYFIKKPLIINAHGDDILYPSFISSFVFNTIKHSDMIVVPSNYFKEIAEMKYKHKNVFVSPSGGIDTNLFKQLQVKEKQDIFTIGFISRIDEGKGWDILLKAVHLLKQKKFKFKVLMIGSGSQNELMLQNIKELHLVGLVDYLGAKPHNELPYYFNQMDVFVFPTTRDAESLGLVGLEAMACGVPVVGSNIGGLPSYISNKKNGLLFEAGNVNDLLSKLEYFLSLDKETFDDYKIQAFNTAKNYDSKLVAKELADRLKEIVQCVEL